jgi:hypothetical protein
MMLDLAPGNYQITHQQANKKNNGLIYRLELESNKTTVHIMCGNGGTEKQRKVAIFCQSGESFVYDDTKPKDYHTPMAELINHFLDVIAGAPINQDFKMTMQIQQILHLTQGNYDK